MNRHSVAAFLSAIAACGAISAGADPARPYTTPPDSFLQYPVYSVSQLLQEIQTDPVVRQRYAAHFQIPEDQIVPWMRKNLVESYVPANKTYTVYCMTPSGKSFYEKQTFHKGTKVFALRSGVPLMKWICGNPLMGFTQSIANKPVITKTAGFPPSPLSPGMQVSSLIAGGNAESPMVIPGTGSSSLYALAALGGVLPVLGFFSSQGGSSPPPLTPHTPPAVPEPTAPLLLMAALPAVVLGVARRRRVVLRG